MTSYAVTTWKANNEAIDEAGNYVLIKGRQAGLLRFLSILRLTFTISISGECITFSLATILGTSRRTIPLENCCSTTYGYTRPWLSAILLGLVLMPLLGYFGFRYFGGSSGAVALGGLLGLIIAIIYFLLSKTLYLSFMEMSGRDNRVAFSGSLLEGIVVDEKSAAYVMTLTQALVDARVTARAVVNPPSN
jgi:hypothetical protein